MNNSIYLKNHDILKKRWPTIIDYLESLDGDIDISFLEDSTEKTIIYKGRHLSSCYNRKKEAEIQNSTIPLNANIAYVYGVGLGDGVIDLLNRATINDLQVYILSPVIFYVYLSYFDASPWLNDKRVNLHLAQSAELNYPYAVNTGELPFTEDLALEIKNLIQIDRNTKHADRHEIQNFDLYKKNYAENLKFIEQDSYIDSLIGKHNSKKFVVIAGGPTATEQFSWLNTHRAELIIIAASTALLSLEKAQIIPDYVVIQDSAAHMAKHFNLNDVINYQSGTLVYNPIASSAAISTWTGLRKIFLTNTNPLIHQLNKEHPKAELYSGGSVAHINVALALLLGAKELILVGYDFCFPFDKTHLEHSAFAKEKKQDTEMLVLNGYNQKVKTYLNLIGYKNALEQFIAIHPEVKFYNTGKDGAIIKGTEWISL